MVTVRGVRLALARMAVAAAIPTMAPRLFERLYGASFYRTMHARWLEALAPAPGSRVIDVGCGPGAFAEDMAARGCSVVGVDRSAKMIAVARGRVPLPPASLRFVVADAEALPVASGWADLAVASSLLNVVRDPQAVLREMARCLRKGGRLSALMPGPDFTVAGATRYVDAHALPVAEGALLQMWTRAPKVANEDACAWFREAGLKEVASDDVFERFVFTVTGRVP